MIYDLRFMSKKIELAKVNIFIEKLHNDVH